MKRIALTLISSMFLLLVSRSVDAQVASVKDSLGGGPVPPEIQDPEVIGINKEPVHATITDKLQLPGKTN